MKEPSADLYDICVVLNEATDAKLGADLMPYAERIKAIVIEAVATEMESWFEDDPEQFVMAEWIRSHFASA